MQKFTWFRVLAKDRLWTKLVKEIVRYRVSMELPYGTGFVRYTILETNDRWLREFVIVVATT